MIVVLDTNIWISALQFGKNYGPPVRALERAMDRDMIAIADEMEAEVVAILTRKSAWSSAQAAKTMDSILSRANRITLRHDVKVCRDLKDDTFLECAALAHAHVLIAGNKDLLVLDTYQQMKIITPLEYIMLEC